MDPILLLSMYLLGGALLGAITAPWFPPRAAEEFGWFWTRLLCPTVTAGAAAGAAWMNGAVDPRLGEAGVTLAFLIAAVAMVYRDAGYLRSKPSTESEEAEASLHRFP